MNELLKKMLLSEKSGENESSSEMDMDASFWKTELECPICFEEMKPPMRIWQCVDGHPVCEGDHHLLILRNMFCSGCRNKLSTKGCPSCNRSVEGRNIALEKMARSLYGDKL